jgi:hypothetical protein
LEALHLPGAWTTSTAEGVSVVVLGPAEPTADALDAVRAAAPDADVTAERADAADRVAIGLIDANESGAAVIALVGDPSSLADESVRRSIQAAVDAGSVVVAPTPPDDTEVPEDLPVVLAGVGADERALSAGVDDPTRAAALVAGAAALLSGLVPPADVGPLLANTARDDERLVDAEQAVTLAVNTGAGGATVPPPEDLEGGLSPATIGLLAFGAAVVAVGVTIALAARTPSKRRSGT